jgi:hypothetical protein
VEFGKTALRIDPGYGPFAAAAPGEDHALADLLTTDEDEIWVVEPEGFTLRPIFAW